MNYDDVPCSTCEGTGYAKALQIPPEVLQDLEPLTEKCPACLGKGSSHDGSFYCTECKGTGKKVIQKDGELVYKCPDCNGTGRVKV